ncbi:MAG: hypothetical protein AAGF28_04285 [Pseudomonadota bacterium]
MTQWDIAFAPLFSWPVIVAIAAIAGLLVLYGLLRRMRGAWLRLLAWASLVLALANPSLLQEEREALQSVVAVVTDRSDSQKLADRKGQTDRASQAIANLIKRFPQFELREVEATNGGAESGDASTALFSRLKSALRDVPPDRVAGAIMITDGQVHDVPENAEQLGFTAPVHTLLTGSQDDKDRRIVIRKAPRFGIVGGTQEIVYSVIDTNIQSQGSSVEVRVSIDGEFLSIEDVVPGEETSFFFTVPHGGKNVIEFQVDAVDDEITTVNNQVFTVLDGVRENLRVLLVSGEPHAGERTWRNLLKSDGSVDLVHFTILRPPEKQDGTPINQLSLIAFPTRELFIEKIDEFDLIIFDRYQRRGVLPVLYFDNIARYLTDGGAILVAAGPEHADIASIHTTPLSSVLPVAPTGNITEGPFRPTVSDQGRKHPVTRDLPGLTEPGSEAPSDWSRWFRIIDSANPQGDVVMEDEAGKPLLVLNRPGEGRIAMLMSDHVWLWARGFEGGGPHTALLRRVAHWLMKEPELDEEALTANAQGNRLLIKRQTMGDQPGLVQILTPTGDSLNLEFTDLGDGVFQAEHTAESLGLYRMANGELTALAHVGPANPREYADVVSTPTKMEALTASTKGGIMRLDDGGLREQMPRIVAVSGSGSTAGDGWFGLKNSGSSVLKGVTTVPLFAGFLGLTLLLLAFAGTWAREGR